MRRVIVALCLTAFLGACSNAPESYDSAAAVADGLRAGDVACDGYQAGEGAELVVDQGSCTSGAAELNIYVFEGETARDRWLQLGARLDDVVVGPTWVVDAGEQAELVSEALGGDIL